jgi:transposase
MMTQEEWMNLQAYRPFVDADYTWAEIGRMAGCDPRTVKKYLQGAPRPPAYGPRPKRPKLIDPFVGVIDTWLRAAPRMQASTIFERLVAEPYRFPGSYQRVKEHVALRRPEIFAELGIEQKKMHRRYEVLPGSQAQVDWGEEEPIETPRGRLKVYSFHMVLSHSRDAFCRYTTSQDLATFWACHAAAFEHFGGVPASILYDRTKTVVRRHVGRGQRVPLHPEAVAFAAHYGFAICLCEGGRPETKGRVERIVGIARRGALDGRTFSSTEEMQAAWVEWNDRRRRRVHRTHGEVIASRAEPDRAALRPLPEHPYVVCERHIRVVGKDALVSFSTSRYSVPWTKVRPSQRVELRVTREEVAIFTIGADPELLATHERAHKSGSWVVDPSHWDGLPDGTRPHEGPVAPAAEGVSEPEDALAALIVRAAAVEVARRDPAAYDRLIEGGSR